MIGFKNLRNIQKKDIGYECTIDLVQIAPDGTEVIETVDYNAVPNGGGLCDAILTAIQNKQFKGGIKTWKAPVAQPSAIREKALQTRWPDAFSLLDDMLKDFEGTKAERAAIKAAHPKE